MNLRTLEGEIEEMPKFSFRKWWGCKHKDVAIGELCTPDGFVNILRRDMYTVCRNCGKIVRESHTYDWE